jgi:glucan phosphorylase
MCGVAPGDDARVERVSLIEEGPEDKVRMANLAIVGSHSTNGVAAIIRTAAQDDGPEMAEIFPQRFNNKTNGVTPRRWLFLANPDCRAPSPMRSATAGSPISARSPSCGLPPRLRVPPLLPASQA